MTSFRVVLQKPFHVKENDFDEHESLQVGDVLTWLQLVSVTGPSFDRHVGDKDVVDGLIHGDLHIDNVGAVDSEVSLEDVRNIAANETCFKTTRCRLIDGKTYNSLYSRTALCLLMMLKKLLTVVTASITWL